MLDKYNDDTPFIQTHKHNENMNIKKLTEEFMELQPPKNESLLDRLLPSPERRLERKHNIEKMTAYHKNQVRIYEAFCLAKQKEVEHNLASALAQNHMVLDAQNKEKFAEIYLYLSTRMDEAIEKATTAYINGLERAKSIGNSLAQAKLTEYAQQKYQEDFALINYMMRDHIKKIKAECDRI